MKHDTTPAFPCANDSEKFYNWIYRGMTLRDYFAAKALMGIMASRNPNSPRFNPEDDAAYVYAVADAMIEAGSK
jgi:hypothetical protein